MTERNNHLDRVFFFVEGLSAERREWTNEKKGKEGRVIVGLRKIRGFQAIGQASLYQMSIITALDFSG